MVGLGRRPTPPLPLLPHPLPQWSSAPGAPAPGDTAGSRRGLEQCRRWAEQPRTEPWPAQKQAPPLWSPRPASGHPLSASHTPKWPSSPSVPKEVPSPTHLMPATLPCTHRSAAWARDMGAGRDPELLGPGPSGAPWGSPLQSRSGTNEACDPCSVPRTSNNTFRNC